MIIMNKWEYKWLFYLIIRSFIKFVNIVISLLKASIVNASQHHTWFWLIRIVFIYKPFSYLIHKIVKYQFLIKYVNIIRFLYSFLRMKCIKTKNTIMPLTINMNKNIIVIGNIFPKSST